MADKKVFTYNPNPLGGEITNRNWFNADEISCESDTTNQYVIDNSLWNKPDAHSAKWRPFHKIADDDFHPEALPPMLTFGKTYKADKGKGYLGARWTMTKDISEADSHPASYHDWPQCSMTAQEAAIAITGYVKSKAQGWTKEDKGFMIDYFGFHGANTSWHQKYCWELYNYNKPKLSLPVKGVSFLIRHPSEDDMHAIHDSVKVNTNLGSLDARSDQVSINGMYGLWYHPFTDKYHCYEMTVFGNRHAPSAFPALENEDPYYYQPYWFSDCSQSNKGNCKNHIEEKGTTYNISAWSNEKIIEECNFCGFVVDNVVDHAATKRVAHTYQMGQLSPIPFHIDRSGKFQAVYGGFRSYNETFQDENGNTVKIPPNFKNVYTE